MCKLHKIIHKEDMVLTDCNKHSKILLLDDKEKLTLSKM